MKIIARDMYAAQGFQLTADERAELVGRADKVRRIITAAEGRLCTDLQTMNVPVVTPAGALIGYLTYQF